MNLAQSARRIAHACMALAVFGCAPASPVPTVIPTAAPATTPAPGASATPAATPTQTASLRSNSAAGVPLLEDGPVAAGRYRLVVDNSCDDCESPQASWPASPVGVDVSVPAGYLAETVFSSLFALDSRAPSGAGLTLGWTSFSVGLNSDPCLAVAHEVPDIPVGPTVDDFVDAVAANPNLDVTEPTDVELGGFRGRFFTLTGPSDIGRCDNWRPWDPGFYVQGPNNIWDVWTIDVDGFRVMIVSWYFPDTPGDVKSELRDMAESISFVPLPESPTP